MTATERALGIAVGDVVRTNYSGPYIVVAIQCCHDPWNGDSYSLVCRKPGETKNASYALNGYRLIDGHVRSSYGELFLVERQEARERQMSMFGEARA